MILLLSSNKSPNLSLAILEFRYSGVPSPYYKASHLKLQEIARKWTETHLMDQAQNWEENQFIDHATNQQAAKDGLIVSRTLTFCPFFLFPFTDFFFFVLFKELVLPNIGRIRIPKEWTKHVKIITDIPPEEWGGFHAFILQDELMRCGSAGWIFISPPKKTDPADLKLQCGGWLVQWDGLRERLGPVTSNEITINIGT
ncbi:hypothetical protein MJO28_012935 [Puccinia striiformis f. sp. tritici]|uniref:Uncharacterized protein n=1 Tax=Puccinia striiformis f. sp. tritici TaxID=168172 RepID=A0ACC0DXE2_9BASI|nr:hypothetical protein MJO28_012935 [Puccinia striiformis f. sp. tritici]